MLGCGEARNFQIKFVKAASIVLTIVTVAFCWETTHAMAQTNDSTVLITGSNRGIGLAFAQAYAEAGWNVIATSRSPENAEGRDSSTTIRPAMRAADRPPDFSGLDTKVIRCRRLTARFSSPEPVTRRRTFGTSAGCIVRRVQTSLPCAQRRPSPRQKSALCQPA